MRDTRFAAVLMRSSGILLGTSIWLVTDVSEQHIGTILKGTTVHEGELLPEWLVLDIPDPYFVSKSP